MNKNGQTVIFVHIADSRIKDQEHGDTFDIPPRSRLYGLEPIKAKTVWVESLTSYINRLGWRHGVSPRALVEQEIVPYLRSDMLRRASGNRSTFGRENAMRVNGVGSVPVEWATLLGQLTGRSDLHLLTLRQWISDELPSHMLLKKRPAWCPRCYTEWREQRLPIYQPLLWMLQFVNMCTKHQSCLETCCPHCQENQSAVALKTSPGHCTQCNTWLGTTSDQKSIQEINDETVAWQEWIVYALEELYIAHVEKDGLHWKDFFTHLAECMKKRESYRALSHLTGINHSSFVRWMNGVSMPSFEMLLSLCYVCHVTPYQVMIGQLTPILQVIQSGISSRPSRVRRSFHQVDHARCLELIQAILDGREELLGVRQLAQRLGHEPPAIKYHFPQECALITERAREYRRQRKEKRVAACCEEVREVVITLHKQGIFPSFRTILTKLSNPLIMRMPETREAWHSARREVGIEQ